MDVKEIKRLLDALAASEVREFVYETGDYKMTVKRGANEVLVASTPAPAVQTQVTAPVTSAAAAAPAPVATENSNFLEVTAPIVGTFYSAAGPDVPAYIKVGDRVQRDTVMCIIEAMKLMNEIEAETSGVVREILVQNEDPVEYGQVLFRIEPD